MPIVFAVLGLSAWMVAALAEPPSPGNLASASATPPRPAPAKPTPDLRSPPPRLVLAGGPVVGPHAFGNTQCRSELAECQTTGTFFGVGVQSELRGQIWRPLYLHARALLVANVSPRDPIYRGLWGLGAGFGAYGRHAFGRAEYLFADAFGSNRFARPFGDGKVARDVWGYHAGVFSVGARLPVRPRWSAELWGGFMVGPHSTRTIPDEEVERRTLLTFLIGFNMSYDLLLAREPKR